MNKKDQILNFFKLRDNIELVVKEYVQDKSIPLDDRWEIFEKSGFGCEKSWIQHLESLNDDIVMYDGLVHADRHQTVSVFEILERYYEHLQDALENTFYCDKIKEWQKYKFNPVAFQKECLEKFVKGWVYDW